MPDTAEPTPPLRYRFPATMKVKSNADFQRAYARKRSAADRWLVVYICENGLNISRLGVSVSKKVGGAVQRNRVKRLFREAFRLMQHDLPTGWDVILIPRRWPSEPTIAQLEQSLLTLVCQSSGTRLPRPSP